MGVLSEDIFEKIKNYLDGDIESGTPPSMLIDLAMEEFKRIRNYPNAYTDEKIEIDMRKHINTIAMAVIEVFNKTGAEGQTSHSENGTSRTWENAFISTSLFKNIVPFVNVR